jgi:hypothetical protein
MCWLPWSLRASTFWNPQGLSRPAMGLLYFYLSMTIDRICKLDARIIKNSGNLPLCSRELPNFWNTWYGFVDLKITCMAHRKRTLASCFTGRQLTNHWNICMRKLDCIKAIRIKLVHSFIIIYFLWLCSPARSMAPSYHEISWSHTTAHHSGRTPLDEWSARRRDL